jgi:hypothetical protein
MKRAAILLAFTPFLLSACGFCYEGPPPDGEHDVLRMQRATLARPRHRVGGTEHRGARDRWRQDQYENPDAAITSGIIWAAVSGVSAAVGSTR